MTVKELIEELKKFPQDKEVVYSDSLILLPPNKIYEYKPVYGFDPYIEGDKTIVVIDTQL